jgi:hypothetical protein
MSKSNKMSIASIIKHIDNLQAFDYNTNSEQEEQIAEQMYLLLKEDTGNQSTQWLLDVILNMSNGFSSDFLYTTSMMLRELIKIVAGLKVNSIGTLNLAETVSALAGISRLFEEMAEDKGLFRAMCKYACEQYSDCVDTKSVALWYYQTLVVDRTGYNSAERVGITNNLSITELISALEVKIKKAG